MPLDITEFRAVDLAMQNVPAVRLYLESRLALLKAGKDVAGSIATFPPLQRLRADLPAANSVMRRLDKADLPIIRNITKEFREHSLDFIDTYTRLLKMLRAPWKEKLAICTAMIEFLRALENTYLRFKRYAAFA
ncbi:hypothetical protein HY642_00330 [Candidatus Woesearchaeota archaeon]|nr:hypothetical protein [Candidatus Woesearchaeota archaeon]